MKIAELLSQMFLGHPNAYGTYTIESNDGGKLVGRATTIRQEVTEELWEDHVSGRQGIGIIPINPDNECRFGAIDIDVYPINYAEVAAKVSKLKLPLIPCKSKSGGLHLYMFAEEWIAAELMQKKLKEFATKLGYGGCEIFPKQTKLLAERGDVGGWINMPYFDIKEGQSKRCAVWPDGTAMEVDEFFEHAKTKMVTEDILRSDKLYLCEELPDGPPCLHQILFEGVTKGARNSVMSNICRYMTKAEPENPLQILYAINKKYFDPPMDDTEVARSLISAQRKEYMYSCTQSPFKNFCNKELCGTKKYGISRLHSESFELCNLSKYNTDPPIWFVSIAGLPDRLELTTDELTLQPQFSRKCINALNICPPRVKLVVWEKMIQKLLKEVAIIEAPTDTSQKGQLLIFLESFCTSKTKAKHRDEMVLGKPWIEEGRHFFRLADFMAYLERNHFKEFKLNQVASIIKEVGGETGVFEIMGRPIAYWSLPEYIHNKVPFKIDELPKERIM